MTDDKTRSLVFEREVAGTPEEVWEALTTDDGLRQWFPLDARVGDGEGGTIWLSWGPGCEGEAPIHVWEPARRFGWTEAYGDDEFGRPIRLAVDFYIEGQEGSTVVRLVQSGFSTSTDWDEMYDAIRDGWTYFMFNLGHYLLKHRGKSRTMVWRRVATDLARDAVWDRLVTAGLISAAAAAGGEPHPNSTPASVRFGADHVAEVVSARAGHHFAATLPSLDDSVLFIELEGSHVGLWLSTYGMEEGATDSLQAALDGHVSELFEV